MKIKCVIRETNVFNVCNTGTGRLWVCCSALNISPKHQCWGTGSILTGSG